MKRHILIALVAALLVTGFAATAVAQDLSHMSHATAGPSGPHSSGILIRGSLGVGSTAMGVDDAYETRLYGATVEFGMAVGAIVAPNLALHGSIWLMETPSPRVDRSVGPYTLSSYESDRTLSLAAFGPGATVFLGPSNFYLTGSAGPAFLTTEIPSAAVIVDRSFGFAGDLGIGKEWFIGPNLGLGLAAHVGGFAVSGNDYDDHYDGFGGWHGSLRMSMTLN